MLPFKTMELMPARSEQDSALLSELRLHNLLDLSKLGSS
jgi:hypothetical protein